MKSHHLKNFVNEVHRQNNIWKVLMASRKLYMREWRKGNLVQRHCKDCNVEIGKFKHRCSECRITKRRADSRARYKRNPEIAEKARKWREANPDRIEEYKKNPI